MNYPATPTYWLDPTNMMARGLRRYAHTARNSLGERDLTACAHSAIVYVDRVPAHEDERYSAWAPSVDHSDPRWPTHCASCKTYQFTVTDVWQDWAQLIYERADGRQYVLHPQAGADALNAPAAPPGAMWDAVWLPEQYAGPDGIHLMVRLPNGNNWSVDSEANNCTRKGERHQCWVRHGDPRLGNLTVDKNGDTCAAGAGSIASGDYHGFLQNGVLTAG